MKKRGYPTHPGEQAYETAKLLSSINIAGNITPPSWFRNLTYDGNGRPNVNAITVLAEIVYWIRPIHDGFVSGDSREFRKKFKSDLLQLSYGYFVDKFGFTKNQVKSAFSFLEKKELVRREFRSVRMSGGGMSNNVMFIELNPNKLRAITGAPYDTESGQLGESTDRALKTERNDLTDSKSIAVQSDLNTNTKTSQQTNEENNNSVYFYTDSTHLDHQDAAISQKHDPQHEMIRALGRVLVQNLQLNLPRLKKFANQLINSGNSAVQLETWYTHPDDIESVKERYGFDVVERIPNHSWFFFNHWVYVRNDPGQYPTEKWIRESIVKASEGISMAGSFKKDRSLENIYVDPDFSLSSDLARDLEDIDLGDIDFDTPINLDHILNGEDLPALTPRKER